MHPFEFNYIIFSIALLIILLIHKLGFKNQLVDYCFIGITFIVFVLLHVGVDINSVEDLPRYEQQFYDVSRVSIGNIFEQIRTSDYFYAIFNRIVSYFSKDFVFFLLVYNLVLFGSLYVVIKKYSPYPLISVVLILLFVYNQSLFVVRQYLALSIILLTIPSILQKKLPIYLMLCTVAFFTHSSAIVWVPVYFLYNIKKTRDLVIALVVAIFIISMLNSDLGRYLFLFGLDFSNYFDTTAETSLNAKLIRIIYLVFYVLFLGKHSMDQGINRLCLIILIILTAGYVFAPPIEVVGRMLLYYQCFLIFAIPLTMSKIKSAIIKMCYLIGILIFQGYLIMKGLEEFYFADYRYEGVPVLYMVIVFVAAAFMVWFYKRDTIDDKAYKGLRISFINKR